MQGHGPFFTDIHQGQIEHNAKASSLGNEPRFLVIFRKLMFTDSMALVVCAVSLGSGISRSAQIPTGWEITLDLVWMLSVVISEAGEPTHEQWYLNKIGSSVCRKIDDSGNRAEKIERVLVIIHTPATKRLTLDLPGF